MPYGVKLVKGSEGRKSRTVKLDEFKIEISRINYNWIRLANKLCAQYVAAKR